MGSPTPSLRLWGVWEYMTYADMKAKARALGTYFRKFHGIGQREKIAMWAGNPTDWVIADQTCVFSPFFLFLIFSFFFLQFFTFFVGWCCLVSSFLWGGVAVFPSPVWWCCLPSFFFIGWSCFFFPYTEYTSWSVHNTLCLIGT